MNKHTVEKIGGTSMSRFDDLINNIFIGKRTSSEYYNRIFVVSAYSGITNLLLEHKKNGEPGVYTYYAEGNKKWEKALDNVKGRMLEINRSLFKIGLDKKKANAFVEERVEGVRTCLKDLLRIRSYGHLSPDNYLPPSREFLSALGEAHSAYNTSLILKKYGIKTIFVDFTGWKETKTYPIDEVIRKAFSKIDISKEMPIVTGYTKCSEGMMSLFDRGYSEITFSKLACVTNAAEGIIHKEYHLCTGDPLIFGADKVEIIGNTNFDIADQLADMDMEAIHSSASKEMEQKKIPIRVKNAFDPDHPGTLISNNYKSPQPKIDMICGRNDIIAIETLDSVMVGAPGYDYRLLKEFNRLTISYIAKNTNANTITHYISEKEKNIDELISRLKKSLPNSKINTHEVAIVCVMGTNMAIPGFLSKSADALAEKKINILAIDQCQRQVNMQFVIERDKFEDAQRALHKVLVENEQIRLNS
ncbi:MAG: aspartate kinase [Victivallales bacterium]|nr:aspartate kinase [Victivallales bacterium]